MHKISFSVPQSHLENIKDALFAKGAGKIGNYERCAWQTLGQGQFRPLPGSDPALGEINQDNYVQEYSVEMVCEDHLLSSVLAELVQVHPYETPAYAAWKIVSSLPHKE